ncbi:hypothetical protein AX16_005661 [Volvariella volvacea WC 439]|nr:hypothetical protein AX16_005661 [Volvariella volvacea WC 439]
MAAAQPPVNPWPPEPVHPPGYLSRKALPIKREDGDALTRRDIQYDLLNYIFSNDQKVFTSPLPGKTAKVNFSELYISALKSSSKCSKVLKDKMTETPAFALELAKLSLLTNVGRINTTMAFFPEMRTALRTYHPVPSLQKTDGNAQDAPRIKNCLKAALLPFEQNAPPSTPEEILAKRNDGQRPPTSIVNLVFVISNHTSPLAGVHFDNNINFLDLFLPKKFHSGDRAKAFLWHIYYYMEDSQGPNPFDDDFSRQHLGKAPQLRSLTDQEWARENVDTPSETDWGYRMKIVRINFLRSLMASNTERDRRPRNAAPHFVTAVPMPDATVTIPPPAIAPGVPQARRPRSRNPQEAREDNQFMYYVPGTPRDAAPVAPPQQLRPTVIVGKLLHLSVDGSLMLTHASRAATTSASVIPPTTPPTGDHAPTSVPSHLLNYLFC